MYAIRAKPLAVTVQATEVKLYPLTLKIYSVYPVKLHYTLLPFVFLFLKFSLSKKTHRLSFVPFFGVLVILKLLISVAAASSSVGRSRCSLD